MPEHSKSRIPHNFVFEYLTPLEPKIKPMFGCHALYLGRRLVLILRHRETHPEINGVWIATKREHHESLRKLFPKMHSIEPLGKAPTNWQVLSESSTDFESSVITACELIVKGDPRIGTIPKSKGKKK
jgi:hypothetical protein